MARYMVGDFPGNWMLVELRNGAPVAFALVEKGESTVFDDVPLFEEDSKPPIWFSHISYKSACRAFAGCLTKATLDVSGDSVEIVEANVDMESDPEFRRYLCL